MQLTIADVNTTRLYHFEENEKDNSPNTEHLGFDNSQMAAIPKMHLEFSWVWRHLTKTDTAKQSTNYDNLALY